MSEELRRVPPGHGYILIHFELNFKNPSEHTPFGQRRAKEGLVALGKTGCVQQWCYCREMANGTRVLLTSRFAGSYRHWRCEDV